MFIKNRSRQETSVSQRNRKMSIIRQMRSICQPRQLNHEGKMVLTGHWYEKHFVRSFSIYLTWFFVGIGFSADAVTFLIIISGLAGAALCVPHILWMTVVGAFVLMAFEILDCVDGEVARWRGKSSVKGLYLDLISHILCNPLAGVIGAVHLYFWKGEVKFLIIAFITYAAMGTEHGIRKAFQELKHRYPKGPESPTSATDYRRWQGFGRRLQKVFNVSMETFGIKLIIITLLFMTYAGYELPLMIFCWAFMIYMLSAVVIRILWHYFLALPDLPHEKRGSTV